VVILVLRFFEIALCSWRQVACAFIFFAVAASHSDRHVVVSDYRGATNTYVLLTLEGKFFGGSPLVHLYLNTDPTTPFLSSRADGSRDHTMGKGAQYINATGELFLCGPVVDDRSIECAYFYAGQVGFAQL
jgi:hypothetical protein